jgi:hypothetical protein
VEESRQDDLKYEDHQLLPPFSIAQPLAASCSSPELTNAE